MGVKLTGTEFVSERKRGHQDQRALRAGLRSTVNDIERVKIKDQVKDGVARAMPYTLSADTSSICTVSRRLTAPYTVSVVEF